jgi:Tfp pilus assembly protein PilN
MESVNLIPLQRQQDRQRRRRIRRWIIITCTYALVLVCGVGTAWSLWTTNDEQTTTDLHSASQQIDQYNTALLRLRKELVNITANRKTQQAVENQPNWSKLLILISDPLDANLVLTHCQLITLDSRGQRIAAPTQEALSPEAATTLLTDRQYQLNLAGFGQTQNSVSQYVVRLEQGGLFDHVSMLNSERKTFMDQSALTFAIECFF